MISVGKFKARATGNVVLGESAKKGTPFIELYFRVVDGDAAGEEVRWTGYFSDKTKERTIESLQFCGWAGDDLSEFADGELHGLDASDVQITIEHEEYTTDSGEQRRSPRVAWVNKLGGYLNVQSAMKKDAAAAFAERMRGIVLKMRDKNLGKGDDSFPHGENVPKQTGTGGARKGW